MFFDHGSALYLEDASYAVSDVLDAPFTSGLTVLGFLIGSNWDYPPVLPEMSPWSPFMGTLNSSGTLADEAQKLPSARVSISSQYPHELSPWRVVSSDNFGAIEWAMVHQDLIDLARDAYWYYLGHWDPELRANAYLWDDMYYALLYLPADWQYFTGTPNFGQSDGVVPWVSSDYPSGTRTPYRLLCSTLCIHHLEHLDAVPNHDNDPFRVLVSQAVREDLGIKFLAVAMNGPSTAAPNQELTWTAEVSGGVAPYAFQWYVDGVAAGNAQSLKLTTGNNSFQLRADVTDAVQAVKSVTKLVAVQIAPPTNCQLEWIPPPRYLRVTWVNSGDGASTEVYINGSWVATVSPGISAYYHVVPSGTGGLFYARVRHVNQSNVASSYCSTNSVSVPY